MFLVTGATGNVGGEVVRQLTAAGHPVRAAVRRPDADLPDGVEAVVVDLADADAVRRAADGVDGVFALSGYAGIDEALSSALSSASSSASSSMAGSGVRRIVQLSSGGAPTAGRANAIAAYHIETEDRVRASGIAATMLQPNSFMTNTLQWAGGIAAGNRIPVPFADVPIATVDPADVAAVAVRGLVTDDLAHTAQRLSGPESLLPEQRARALAEVLGRAVEIEPLDDEAARAVLLAAMPEPYVDAQFDFFRAGSVDETVVRSTVADVLGRPATTFRDWAERNAHRFDGH